MPNLIKSLLLAGSVALLAGGQTPRKVDSRGVEAIVFYDFTGKSPRSKTIIDRSSKAWKTAYDLISSNPGPDEIIQLAGDELIAIGLPDDQRNVILADMKPEAADDESIRIISKKHDRIAIFTLLPRDIHDHATVKIKAKEDSRETLIHQEFLILGKQKQINILTIGSKKLKPALNYVLTYQTYEMEKTRSTLSLTATAEMINPDKDKAEAKPSGDRASDDKPSEDKRTETLSLLTGPRETLFLGATVGLKDVKYKDKSVTPSEKPKDLKVGVYWVPFGDVLSDYDFDAGVKRFLGNMFVVHLSGTFSSKPFSSWSYGIGLKYPKVHRGDLKFLSGLSITYGAIWTEGERDGAAGKERFRQHDSGWMIGYDLMAVKSWFK